MKTKLKPLVFRLSVFILRLLCKIYFRAACSGRENYPKTGPFIIAINHNSLMDIPAMALAVDRPLYSMAKNSLFRIPILSWWLRSVGFFPVQRGKGDKLAFHTARQVLAEGGVLALAPEGTRGRTGSGRPKAHTGIVRLAQEFRCPVVPVGVKGTRKALPPGAKFPRPYHLSVNIGKPIILEPLQVNHKSMDQMQQQVNSIMEKVYQLSGENYGDQQATIDSEKREC